MILRIDIFIPMRSFDEGMKESFEKSGINFEVSTHTIKFILTV